MSELRSKCCETTKIVPYRYFSLKLPFVKEWYCLNCHKPTEVEAKEEFREG